MAQLTQPIHTEDHVLGAEDAPVTLVEYGDYQCPHCGEAHPVIKSIIEQMGDQLRFVYRHFPITMSHPLAEVAAQAAEAAGAQGKFWQMHDLLFENQDQFGLDLFVELARKLNLDLERFREDLEEDHYSKRVQNDFNSGVRSGVNGTPTFFINGQRFDGNWQDREEILQVLQSAAQTA